MAEKKEPKIDDLKLTEVQAQIEQMLLKAQQQAKFIVEEAKAATKDEMTREEKDRRRQQEEYWNEYVEVKLFKGSGKYADDVYVAVGEDNCLIQRGQRVKVKRKFAQLLDQSELQDYETTKLIEQSMQARHLADL